MNGNGNRSGYRARLLAVLLLAMTWLAPPAIADDEAVVSVGEVSWVSGGIGDESRERLSALEAGFGFNLKLVFALDSGDYLSAVDVRIIDPAGKTVLQASSGGPIFLARLPAGRYELVATAAGKAQTRKLTLAEGRLASTVFRWPAE